MQRTWLDVVESAKRGWGRLSQVDKDRRRRRVSDSRNTRSAQGCSRGVRVHERVGV